MSNELAKINLWVIHTKCELYLPTNAPVPVGFDSIPIVRDRDLWSYLGSPLSEQTTNAISGAAKSSETSHFQNLRLREKSPEARLSPAARNTLITFCRR